MIMLHSFRKGSRHLDNRERRTEDNGGALSTAEPYRPLPGRNTGGIIRRIAAGVLALLTVAAVLFAGRLPIGREEKPLAQTPSRSRDFLYGDIVNTADSSYTYEDMRADLFLLEQTYPMLFRVSTAGTSADGREILYGDLGNKNANRQILITAGIHGREYLTPLLVMKMTEYYLVNYYAEEEGGTAFADDMKNCLIRVVPMVNPDGVMLAQGGLEEIRSETLRQTICDIYAADCAAYPSYRTYGSLSEYLRYWKANAHGVDLNRNFGIAAWSQVSTGISQPSSQKYKGEEPNSEPETLALIRAFSSLSNPVCVVSFHSQGEILYWDCGQTGTLRTKNETLTDQIAAANGYRKQETFTHPDATFEDWCALEQGIPSVNVEVGSHSSPLVPWEQFPAIWQKNQNIWKVLVQFAGT